MAKMMTLHDLYIDTLRDTYNAESQVTRALPRMAKAASNRRLQDAFMKHLEQTRRQIAKLEELFELNGLRPRGKKCVAMEGLIEEGKHLMEEEADPDVMDAALIAAAQKVEHYEMAVYGTLRTWAELMGHHDQARLLQQILDEEKRTDMNLTQLAESMINIAAERDESE